MAVLVGSGLPFLMHLSPKKFPFISPIISLALILSPFFFFSFQTIIHSSPFYPIILSLAGRDVACTFCCGYGDDDVLNPGYWRCG